MSDQRGRQPGRRQDGVVERRVVVDEQGARLIVPPRVTSPTSAWSSVIPPWAWAGEVAASTVDRQVLGPVADPGAEARTARPVRPARRPDRSPAGLPDPVSCSSWAAACSPPRPPGRCSRGARSDKGTVWGGRANAGVCSRLTARWRRLPASMGQRGLSDLGGTVVGWLPTSSGTGSRTACPGWSGRRSCDTPE